MVPVSTSVKLRTTRLGANDLISTFPAQLGNLENDLCTLFGFTSDTNITESPLLLSNDGKVEKSLLRLYGRDVIGTSGVGFHLKDTGGGGEYATVSMESESVTPALVIRGNTAQTVFSVAASDGSLRGSVVQDGTQTPLIPASAGVDATFFYNGVGSWAKPSSSPSLFGTVATGLATEVDATATPTPVAGWSTGGAHGGNPWGPFEFPLGNSVNGFWNPLGNPTRLAAPNFGSAQPGRWIVFCNIPCTAVDAKYGLDCDVEIYQDGVSIMKQKLYHAGGDPPVESVTRTASMQAVVTAILGHYFEVYITNNNANTGVIACSDPYWPTGQSNPGRFGMIAIG